MKPSVKSFVTISVASSRRHKNLASPLNFGQIRALQDRQYRCGASVQSSNSTVPNVCAFMDLIKHNVQSTGSAARGGGIALTVCTNATVARYVLIANANLKFRVPVAPQSTGLFILAPPELAVAFRTPATSACGSLVNGGVRKPCMGRLLSG